MPNKTRDECKAAFEVMKKPGRPKTVSGKIEREPENAASDDGRVAFNGKIDEIEKLLRVARCGSGADQHSTER